MYSNFKAQAIEYIKQAVQEDNAGNYARAFPLYMNALEYFKTHLKYEKNPDIRDAITKKFTDYLRRAEEIREVLDSKAQPVPKTDAAGDNKGGRDGEGMYCNSMEQATECIKQAVQEDNAGDYAKAYFLYISALEYFKTRLKYENNTEIREAITKKFSEYVQRAQEIRMVIDVGGGCGSSSKGGDGAVEAQVMPKSKSKSEDGDDAKVKGGMYYIFKEQGIEYLKQAIREDNAQNYSKAFPLYMNALEYFKTHLKYEENPKIREAISLKYTEYLGRVEEIRMVLELDVGSGPTSSGSGGAAEALLKPKDGGNMGG